MKEKKLKILTNILGSFYKSRNEYLFQCPYCNHHKRKFSINLEKGYFKCWVCDTRGKNLYRIVRKFGDHHQKQTWRSFTAQTDYSKLEDMFGAPLETTNQVVELPGEFISLANKDIPPTGVSG